MKVLETNAGLLSNFEVLDLLKSRGADKGLGGGYLSAPEFKAYEYLMTSSAASQTRKDLENFINEAEQYKLTKAERLQASNLRPSTAVEVHLIVEDCDERLSGSLVDQFLGMVEGTLPPPPQLPEDDEPAGAPEPQGKEAEEAEGDKPAAQPS